MMENEGEMVAVDLPEEVIREILLRLPVKSLLKFRCVSKSWLSLISSHQFAMAHLNISSNKIDKLIFGSNDLFTRNVKNLYTCSVSSVSKLTTDLVYSVDTENPVYDELLDTPFAGIAEFRWIVGSCNGLVCLSFTNDDILLWNPALKKCKKLPYSGTHFYGYGPLGDGTSHAFGYDKVHDDYKVVEFSNSQLKVYSRRSNSWKVLDNWPGGDASCWPGQFLDGAIYWCVCRSPHWFIVALDLASDEFVELPPPEFEVSNVVVIKVEILDGCVALCCGYDTHMDVWMMKESWVKQLCIPFTLGDYFLQPIQPRPLLFFRDGKILINYGTTLRIFDPINPQPQQLSGLNIDLEEVTVATYFESLVSPSLDEADVCCSTSTSKVI